jgi:integrase
VARVAAIVRGMALITSTQDGRPLYRVRWNYRRDPVTGRRTHDEKRFRKKADARVFERTVTAAMNLDTERITVGELKALWWVRHIDTAAIQLRTRRDYKTQYDLRVGPFLGHRAVGKLTPALMAEFKDWMVAQGVGARSANKSLDMLKSMVRWGRSEGIVTNRNIDDVRRLKAPRPKPANPYTPEQVERIAAGCQHLRDATMLTLAAYTGLRWSELRALRWSDLDLDAEQPHVRLVRSVDADRSIKSTKSDQERTVPILAPGVAALHAWRDVAPGTSLVFPNRNGRPLYNDWYRDRCKAIREACGIDFDPHELRDTYASILIAAGIGELELTLWLGHASVETTRRRYARLFESRKATLAGKANELLAGGTL